MEKASLDEMREEALLRLELLRLPEKLLQQLRSEFKLKVTYFSGEVGDTERKWGKCRKFLPSVTSMGTMMP